MTSQPEPVSNIFINLTTRYSGWSEKFKSLKPKENWWKITSCYNIQWSKLKWQQSEVKMWRRLFSWFYYQIGQSCCILPVSYCLVVIRFWSGPRDNESHCHGSSILDASGGADQDTRLHHQDRYHHDWDQRHIILQISGHHQHHNSICPLLLVQLPALI